LRGAPKAEAWRLLRVLFLRLSAVPAKTGKQLLPLTRAFFKLNFSAKAD
jgi:hypothetical protein